MRVQSLRRWMVVPLLLSIPAVMSLVIAAEVDAAECSSSGQVHCNELMRRGVSDLGLDLDKNGGALAGGLALDEDLDLDDDPYLTSPKIAPTPTHKPKTKTSAKRKPTQTTIHSPTTAMTRAPRTRRPTTTIVETTTTPTTTPTTTGVEVDPTLIIHPNPPYTTTEETTTTSAVESSTTTAPKHTEPLTPSVVTIPFIGIHTPEMTMTTTTTMTMTATATATTTTETNTQNPSDTLSHTISPTPSPASPSSPTLSGSTSPTSTDVPSVTVSVSSVSPSPTSPSSPGVTVTVSLTPLPTLTTTTENGTVSGGPATPTPTPTGTDSTMPTITTTTAQSGSRITTATAITTTAPSSPTTTVHSPTPTITTTTTPHTTTKKHRPTKTTTPWLPSTIEPIGPPKTTQTASPGTSLPDVVIPNMSPKIPSNSFNVHLRFEHVSYAQVIDNGVLAAQLVSFVPAQLGPLLKVDVDQILVLAIRDGSTKANGGSGRRARKRALVTSKNVDDAIMATVAIPSKSYWALNTLVRDTHSALYQAGDTSFGQYIDSSFPLSRNPPANSDQKGSSGTMNPLTGENFGSVDPNAVTAGGSDGSGGSTHGAVIGSLVGLATAAYVGIAMVAVKVWRKKKLREQEERDKLHRSISAPISVQGSSQGWAWHG